MLLCGALVISTGTLVSCTDNSDLENRITVLEGLVRELNTAVAAGETIRNAVENPDGSWTLTLSGGRTITTGVGGGGGNVSVVPGENSITITIGDDSWVLPLGPGFRSLVFIPEFADGEVRLNSYGFSYVRFLARPALSAAQFASAEFGIASARGLQTRSYASLFDIDGTVTIDGDYITVPLRAMGGEGRTFAVAVEMTLSGGVYVSNFFNVVVPAELQGLPENLTTPTLVAAVTDLTHLGDGVYTATIPSTADFLAGMNFADLFTGLPAGATFRLGAPAEQNNNVLHGTRLATLRSSLAENGAFNLTARLGHALMAPTAGYGEEQQPHGFLVNVIYNNTIIHKIYWQIYDPLANLNFTSTTLPRGDMEWGMSYTEPVWLMPGVAQVIDFNALIASEVQHVTGGMFMVGDIPFLFHGAYAEGAFAALRNYSVSTADGIVVHFFDDKFRLGPIGEALLGPGSRGLVWDSHGSNLLASGRRNLPSEYRPNPRYETIVGWANVSAAEMLAAPLGVYIAEDGRFVTTTDFGGHGWRLDPRLRIEYAFGYRWVGRNNGGFIRLFINRRHADASVVDPAPRTP